MNTSIDFFENQFQKPVGTDGGAALNPFETAALAYLRGRVLDFGCGLGNLAVAAARNGCSVLALDASPTAIRHIGQIAAADKLDILAVEADLATYALDEDFDAVVSIGLLMFFDCATALRQLAQLQARTVPGGIAVINVLIEGTTYRDMFDAAGHCLLAHDRLRQAFAGWTLLFDAAREFPAPGDTVKSFATLIARKPETA